MTVRSAGVVVLAALLMACGGAPRYTIRQATIDLQAYESGFQFYDTAYDACVANYLFQHLSPSQVKAIVQGADFGYTVPVIPAAESWCARAS